MRIGAMVLLVVLATPGCRVHELVATAQPISCSGEDSCPAGYACEDGFCAAGSADGAAEDGDRSIDTTDRDGDPDLLPHITSVTPGTSWNDEVTAVTVTGSGFAAGATVQVDAAALADPIVDSHQQLRVTLPAGLAPGWHDITVTNPDTAADTCSECFVASAPVLLSGQQTGLVSYGELKVVLNGTVTLALYNGIDDISTCDTGETGCLRIVAGKIVVPLGSRIDGVGRGWGGGGGGGGGTGRIDTGCATPDTCQAGAAKGAGGVGAGGGVSGHAGYCVNYCCGTGDSHCSLGGAGGHGGGPAGGTSGTGGTGTYAAPGVGPAGSPGGDGLYVTTDEAEPVDESIRMGSGGGGGGGAAGNPHDNYCDSSNGGGGGGAGARGGGLVALIASREIVIDGTIAVTGAGAGGNGVNGVTTCSISSGHCDKAGSGGKGGDADLAGSRQGGSGGTACSASFTCSTYGDGPWHAWAGGVGGTGGVGAGGGVLLEAPWVTVTGGIDAKDGAARTEPGSGGTVKVFYQQGTSPPPAVIAARRYYAVEY